MKQKICVWLMILLLALGCVMPALAAAAPEPEHYETTILFTHDLHSHFLPQPTETGGESGGYARLKTAIDAQREKHPDALVLDGGDFSIGSLIQALYVEQAAELRTMGSLGYDVTTIGNHEFDHTDKGFAEMLRSAKGAQDAVMPLLASSRFPAPGAAEYAERFGPVTIVLPEMVCANYKPKDEDVAAAMEEYGVREYTLLERGGIRYGIFGLVGVDSDECAPTSNFVREDARQAAKRCVEALKAQGAEFIICLSHSGTGDSLEFSEDEELAKGVEGIDVIISGHTHSTLTQPVIVNNTYIVSAGPYCRNLGVLSLQWKADGSKSWQYELVPIDETLPDDPDVAELVEEWKDMVGESYLARYELSYDQVLTTTDFPMRVPVGGVQEGNPIGELVADAFLWAVENLEADAPDVPTLTVTADGVLRANLAAGDITTSQTFDVLSMGVGADGSSGFPLVEVYLTGKEVKATMEVDASVTPIMYAAQLFMSGVQYSFNTNRMFFNRLTDAYLCEPWWANANGAQGLAKIDDNALYRVVTGMYSAQMLGTVKGKSLGILSLEPKFADGSPVDDFNKCILRDAQGNEIKEWYALAAYLEHFGEEGVPQRYAAADGRKDVTSGWNPVELLRGANWITLVVLLVLVLLILGIALIVRGICRRVRRKKKAQK